MIKAITAVLFLTLACQYTLCTALPSMLSRTVSSPAQTEPNVPRALLGRPYRTRWEDAQPCPPPPWTVVLADCNDVDASTSTGPAGGGSTHRARPWARTENEGWMQNTTPRVPPPLPLVINTVPESRWAGLRPRRIKRPQGDTEGLIPRDAHEERVRSRVVVGKKRPCDVRVQVGRSKRGEWKSTSRLIAEQV